MKEWKLILNEKRDIDNQKEILFDLADNEDYTEYRIWFGIQKHTGDDTCKGNLELQVGRHVFGYYIMNYDFKTMIQECYVELECLDIPVCRYAVSTVSLHYNLVQLRSQLFIQDGDIKYVGKFRFNFPALYKGNINIKIIAR